MEKVYRKNVAIIVLNKKGEILACERSDNSGAWQIPQGGIEKGETDEKAMSRELEEEIGTNAVDLIAKLPNKIRYDWPKKIWRDGYCGQEQVYFLTRIKDETKISLNKSQEFADYQWLTADKFISIIKGFKAEAYTRAIKEFRILCPEQIR